MKSIIDYLITESINKGYVVSYKNKNTELNSFLIETDDSIEEFAKKIFKNDLAEDYFCSLLRAGMSSGCSSKCYKEEFIKYLEGEGLEKDGLFSISTLKDYMKKAGNKKPSLGRKLEI